MITALATALSTFAVIGAPVAIMHVGTLRDERRALVLEAANKQRRREAAAATARHIAVMNAH